MPNSLNHPLTKQKTVWDYETSNKRQNNKTMKQKKDKGKYKMKKRRKREKKWKENTQEKGRRTIRY